jgi:hypothetical protein
MKTELAACLVSGALARPLGRAQLKHLGALPNGRASAPHHVSIGSNTQSPSIGKRGGGYDGPQEKS